MTQPRCQHSLLDCYQQLIVQNLNSPKFYSLFLMKNQWSCSWDGVGLCMQCTVISLPTNVMYVTVKKRCSWCSGLERRVWEQITWFPLLGINEHTGLKYMHSKINLHVALVLHPYKQNTNVYIGTMEEQPAMKLDLKRPVLLLKQLGFL